MISRCLLPLVGVFVLLAPQGFGVPLPSPEDEVELPKSLEELSVTGDGDVQRSERDAYQDEWTQGPDVPAEYLGAAKRHTAGEGAEPAGIRTEDLMLTFQSAPVTLEQLIATLLFEFSRHHLTLSDIQAGQLTGTAHMIATTSSGAQEETAVALPNLNSAARGASTLEEACQALAHNIAASLGESLAILSRIDLNVSIHLGSNPPAKRSPKERGFQMRIQRSPGVSGISGKGKKLARGRGLTRRYKNLQQKPYPENNASNGHAPGCKCPACNKNNPLLKAYGLGGGCGKGICQHKRSVDHQAFAADPIF